MNAKWFVPVVVIAAFAAGYAFRPAGSGKTSGRKPLYYHDPMHPAYKSDKPGIAPDCGMQLEPVYAEDAAAADTGPLPPGAVRVSVDRQQVMGLRTAPVAHSSGAHTLRLLGRVTPDDTKVYRVTALAEGVVTEVSPLAVGNLVRKDDLLAQYFVATQELYSAFQGYFLAMNARAQGVALVSGTPVDPAGDQVKVAEDLLKVYGLTDTQLRELTANRQARRDIQFRSPVDGLILLRDAALGQKLERGKEIFRIANLKRVWVLADVFENDSGLVRPGLVARVRYRERVYRTSVGNLIPAFDAASRTLKLRLELDNADLVLRPDMFVDVELDVKEPEGISVPVDAVLDSGMRKAVFVKTGEGLFESRDVTTGTRYADRVQITSGLQDGDAVVVSGMFLLDSESRLQMAAASSARPALAPGAELDPVCGMQVDPARTTHRSEHQGAAYHFCSKTCKDKFDAAPVRYAAKGGRS